MPYKNCGISFFFAKITKVTQFSKRYWLIVIEKRPNMILKRKKMSNDVEVCEKK